MADVTPCSRCDGAGEMRCPVCSGTSDPANPCPQCDGSGAVRCSLCNGTGEEPADAQREPMSLNWSEALAIAKSSKTPRDKRRLACEWLNAATDDLLVWWVNQPRPNVATLIRKVHPRPESEARGALYRFLLLRDEEINGAVKALPGDIHHLEDPGRAPR